MRLPLTFAVDSRDGDADKDGRLTNVLVAIEEEGQFAELRPGLEVAVQSAGAGNGIVCFGGELISIFGAVLGSTPVEGSGGGNVLNIPFEGALIETANSLTLTPVGGNQSFVSTPITTCGDYAYSVTDAVSYIAIAPNSVVHVGTSDWTVECWVYTSDAFLTVFRIEDDSSENVFTCEIQYGQISFNWEGTSYSTGIQGNISIASDTWTHLAWVRDIDLITVYVGGAVAGTLAVPFGGAVTTDGNGFFVSLGEGVVIYKDFAFSDYAKYLGVFTPACFDVTYIPSIAPVADDPYDFAQSPL